MGKKGSVCKKRELCKGNETTTDQNLYKITGHRVKNSQHKITRKILPLYFFYYFKKKEEERTKKEGWKQAYLLIFFFLKNMKKIDETLN